MVLVLLFVQYSGLEFGRETGNRMGMGKERYRKRALYYQVWSSLFFNYDDLGMIIRDISVASTSRCLDCLVLLLRE